MIKNFLNEFPQMVYAFIECIKNKAKEDTNKLAHKMKSPMRMFGLGDLLDLLNKIKEFDFINEEKQYISQNINEDLNKFSSDFDTKASNSIIIIKSILKDLGFEEI